MKKLGKHSFKDELREVIRYEISLEKNRSFDDVIRSLNEDYGVECRIAGSTISYRHPGYTDKTESLFPSGEAGSEICSRKKALKPNWSA